MPEHGLSAISQGYERKFRGIRAALAFHESDYDEPSISKMRDEFARINVKLFSTRELTESLREEDFDVLGFLWTRPFVDLSAIREQQQSPDCLLIGFSASFEKSLRQLDAGVICRGSILSAVLHFFESLTLPSLLNIDLADLAAIARGIGISFYEEGDSARELIKRLPDESFVARSCLLHFACRKEVTLEEVYSISRAISLRQPLEKSSDVRPANEYRRFFNIKMGMRVVEREEIHEESFNQPRISLTAILFGI